MNLTLIKGAPELILPKCKRYIDENGVRRELSSSAGLKKTMKDMASRAVRLLALAVTEDGMNSRGINENLTLLGIVAIRDEIQPRSAQGHSSGCRCGNPGRYDYGRQ